MSELDLSAFLKDASVADLDWLDVDELQYREMDKLPRQNLDIQPDLQALWAREGESPTNYLVPNVVPVPTPGVKDPKTMGDMSQEHGRLRTQAMEIRKVARLALMQSTDANRLRGELVKRFGIEPLREHRTVLAEVLQERGLLGKLYIAASDFPNCAQNGTHTDFVRKYAKDARFVLAKSACGGCCHATKTPTGGSACGVFQKEIQVDIPYSIGLAASVETTQKAKGLEIQASELPPKDRIRLAFLASKGDRGEAYAGQGINVVPKPVLTPSAAGERLVEASSLLRKKQAETQLVLEAKPVVDFLHREMAKGLTHANIVKSLKLAFDTTLLAKTHTHWGPIFKEAGLYGVIYTKQASFDDCHVGADFLAKHNPSVRAIVAGEKCGSCIYNKTRCLLYGKPLVKSASEIVTDSTVDVVLQEHRMAGRLPAWETKTASTWGDTPAKALKAIHEAVQRSMGPQQAPIRMGFMQGFYGQVVPHVTAGLTRRDIAKQASKYMNEGLYGQDLLSALRTRYEPRDLFAAKDELRVVLAEQGLQGIYYVDPSVYEDYGRGCDEASRLHRTRMVGYVKQGPKCTSCVHQTKLGFCSKIHKQLVDEPPYADKLVQQREILASGSSMDVSYASLVNNATSTLAEFQMQNELDVDVQAAFTPNAVTIQFGTGKVAL
jgi:hypothetical protein